MAEVETQFAETLTELDVTVSTFTDSQSLTFTPTADTNYLLLFGSTVRAQSDGADIAFLDGDGSTILTQANLNAGLNTDEWRTFNWLLHKSYGASPSSQTFRTQVKASSGGFHIWSRDRRILALALGPDDQFSSSATEATTTSTAWQDANGALTFTPAAAGDYIILAACKYRNSGLGSFFGPEVKLTDGTNDYGTTLLRAGGTDGGGYYFWATKITLAAAGQTWKLQFRSNGSNTAAVDDVAIFAIRADRFANVYGSRDATDDSTTSTTLQDATGSLTQTPAGARHHLALLSGVIYNDTLNMGVSRKTLEGATVVGQQLAYRMSDTTTLREPSGHFSRNTLVASSTTWKWQYAVRATDSGTAHIIEKDIVVLDLEAAGAGGGTTISLGSMALPWSGASLGVNAKTLYGLAASDFSHTFTNLNVNATVFRALAQGDFSTAWGSLGVNEKAAIGLVVANLALTGKTLGINASGVLALIAGAFAWTGQNLTVGGPDVTQLLAGQIPWVGQSLGGEAFYHFFHSVISTVFKQR